MSTGRGQGERGLMGMWEDVEQIMTVTLKHCEQHCGVNLETNLEVIWSNVTGHQKESCNVILMNLGYKFGQH